MAYFSNGCEGEGYRERYCYQCQNHRDKGDGRGEGCAVWDAHLLFNHEEHKNPKSILHVLIPRKEGGGNAECSMYLPTQEAT